MTDLDPKGLEAGADALRKMYRGGGEDEPFHLMTIAAIRAYLASSPTTPVEAEAVAADDIGKLLWTGEIVRGDLLTHHRDKAMVVGSLIDAVSALQARVRELEGELARRDMQLEVSANVALQMSNALEISHFAPWLRGWVKARFGKWITHNTAKGALAEYRAALSPVQQEGGKP